MTGSSIVTPLENLWGRVGEFLPNFLAAVVLLVIGVAIALGIRLLVIKLLNSIGWERLAKRSPALRILEVGDIRYPFFELIGAVVLLGGDPGVHRHGGPLHRPLLRGTSDRPLRRLPPDLFLAFVILALGAWVGGLAGRFARAFARTAQVREANLIGKGVQYLVIVIALGTALEQLNVATRFLFGAFLIVLGLWAGVRPGGAGEGAGRHPAHLQGGEGGGGGGGRSPSHRREERGPAMPVRANRRGSFPPSVSEHLRGEPGSFPRSSRGTSVHPPGVAPDRGIGRTPAGEKPDAHRHVPPALPQTIVDRPLNLADHGFRGHGIRLRKQDRDSFLRAWRPRRRTARHFSTPPPRCRGAGPPRRGPAGR